MKLAANLPWSQVAPHMRTMPVTRYATLPNGFRVACEHVPALPFTTVGVWIDAGSRLETHANNGVAHFLEHMNFKGTKNHSKRQIESMFEYLAAHFNAYTSRDRTAYYIKVLLRDVDRVMDLLSDVLKHSVYREDFVELERPTILAEMREVESIVEEVILDRLHGAAYDTSVSGLPMTILGPTENIARRIDRGMIEGFIRTHYTAPRMTLVTSGGLSFDDSVRIAERCFGDLPGHSAKPPPVSRYVGGQSVLWNTSMLTSHASVAIPGCGVAHPDAYALQLTHHLFGSFKAECREAYVSQGRLSSLQVPGLEAANSFFTPYEETSLLGFTFVVNDEATSGSLSSVVAHYLRALEALADKGPSAAELDAAKGALKAAILSPLDSTTNSAEDLGRQCVQLGKRRSLEEAFEAIDAVTVTGYRDVLRRYALAEPPTMACVGAPTTIPPLELSLRL